MIEHSFSTKIISGHRVTIRDDIYKDLGFKEGDRIRVAVEAIKNPMLKHAVVTDGQKDEER